MINSTSIIRFLKRKVAELEERVKKLEQDQLGFVDEMMSAPSTHDYFKKDGKHPMKKDIFKKEEEIFGPKKKRKYPSP